MAEARTLNWIITNDFGGNGNVCLDVKLEGTNYEAFIKWDGCCEITDKDALVSGGELFDSTFHICDVPRFIEILQSLEDFRMNNIDGAE